MFQKTLEGCGEKGKADQERTEKASNTSKWEVSKLSIGLKAGNPDSLLILCPNCRALLL